MNKRYAVTDGDRTFAFVHATNAADAIRIACEKVEGHDPSGCTAAVIGDNDGGFGRDRGRNDDQD